MDRVQHDHRDLALGLALIVGIGGPELKRLVPEARPFRAGGGPRPRLELPGPDLNLDHRVGQHVLVPARMLGRAALGGDHEVAVAGLAIELVQLARERGHHDGVRAVGDGYAQLLEMSAQNLLSEKQIKNVTGIIESAQYLTTLVNNLLDQAKLEEGKLKLNIVPFDPAEIIDQIESNLTVPAQSKGLELVVDIDAEVPDSVEGDPDRVQQILANLVNNAIKFTEEGSVNVRLYCPDVDHWAIQVSDTGPGIPKEAQGYIFEAFRQVDGQTQQGHNGTGLGLSIVKQLTTLMGGSVLLESEIGHGATFTITLPLESPAEEAIV